MLEIVLDEEVVASDNGEDDIDHTFCVICHPDGDISFCGMDIRNLEMLPEDEWYGPYTPNDCAMCLHEWENHDCFA